MKSLLIAIRRAVLLFQIRSLEITVDGQNQALECVRDQITRQRIEVARMAARRELARLRAKYNATLPPGRRVTWSMA